MQPKSDLIRLAFLYPAGMLGQTLAYDICTWNTGRAMFRGSFPRQTDNTGYLQWSYCQMHPLRSYPLHGGITLSPCDDVYVCNGMASVLKLERPCKSKTFLLYKHNLTTWLLKGYEEPECRTEIFIGWGSGSGITVLFLVWHWTAKIVGFKARLRS